MPEIKTCCYCKYQGEDVNAVAHIYIGGQGDVEYPCCDDKQACLERILRPRPTIESLQGIVDRLKVASDNLRSQLYPTGKPDWMSQDKWLEIGGE